MFKNSIFQSIVLSVSLFGLSAHSEEQGADQIEFTLDPFTVWSGGMEWEDGRAFSQIADALAGEVSVDLQSRGGNAYQVDIVTRGGTFENTGIRVGGLNLFDPQTGHYSTEIPINPKFLETPNLLTGTQNAQSAFNSNIATIDFGWAPIREGGEIGLLVGGHSWIEGELTVGHQITNSGSLQLSLGAGSGDGTVRASDFDFERFSGRYEMQVGNNSLVRFFGGYISKFYGWPGMYTGITGLDETDSYQVGLVGLSFETESAEDYFFRIGAYWRSLVDDYGFSRAFDRDNPGNDLFEHETEVASFQLDGWKSLGLFKVHYDLQYFEDSLERSTSLTVGQFNSRDYGKASASLEYSIIDEVGRSAQVWIGATLDTSSQDSTQGSPFVEFKYRSGDAANYYETFISYAETTQVTGYTALKSPPSGPFGGNVNLGREFSDIFELGVAVGRSNWRVAISAFYREDESLVDWTFSSASTSQRQANPVDLEVKGVESQITYQGEWIGFTLGYAFLDKDADYGTATVDASYYALNYAEHKLNFILSGKVDSIFNWKLQGEYGKYADNLLRTSDNTGFNLLASVEFPLPAVEGLSTQIFVDNIFNDDFQIYPGALASGRQWSLLLNYVW